MKALFLDIDGVLNTDVTALLHGLVWGGTENAKERLDPYGMMFIKRLVHNGVKIVLSSSWRVGFTLEESQATLGFPLYGRTRTDLLNADRGVEIQDFLDKHPEITSYVIVDDNDDMLPTQMDRLALINPSIGLGLQEMEKIGKILELNIWTLKKLPLQ